MVKLCLSIDETQQVLGIGRTLVYKMIGEGKLDVVKIGRRTLVRTSSVRAVAGEQGDPFPTPVPQMT